MELPEGAVERNIARWKHEQEVKNEKRARTRAQAVSALTAELKRVPKEHEVRAKIKFILAERRSKWLLKSCRATIGEIMKSHGEPK